MKKFSNKTKRRYVSSKQHGKTRKGGTNVRNRVLTKIARQVFLPFTRKTTDIENIKKQFITTCNKERKLRGSFPDLVKLQSEWGSLPLPVIIPPKHSLNVSQQNAKMDKSYQVMGAADTIVRATANAAASGAVISTGFILGVVCPPVMLVSVTLAVASFLVCQAQKNIELVNTSELIMIICQNMVEDLTRMLVFYTRIKLDMEAIKVKNPFIDMVLKKLTQLQISIIKTTDKDVVKFMAVSYGILQDDWKTLYSNEDIFGTRGMKYGCNIENGNDFCEMAPSEEAYTKILQNKQEEEAKKQKPTYMSTFFSSGTNPEEGKKLLEEGSSSTNDSQSPETSATDNGDGIVDAAAGPGREKNGIEGTGKTFSSIKRAIITRLGKYGITRVISNASSPYELYRELIRDITIIGLLFSQASARFSLDGLENHQTWIETQSGLNQALEQLKHETQKLDIIVKDLQKVKAEEQTKIDNNSETHVVEEEEEED